MNELVPQAFGWYGKLPARGDFVGRGLPSGWLGTWDEWLQRSLAGAAKLGGKALRARLLAMPAWQCVVLPQQAGDPVWCGVVVASSDRVGRAFPLLVAEACDAARMDLARLADLQSRAACLVAWLEQARSLPSPQDFDRSAARLGPIPLSRGADDAAPATARLLDLREAWPAAASFWWRLDAAADPPAVLAEAWPPREALLLEWLEA